MQPTLRLSVGASPLVKALMAVVAVILMIMGLFFVIAVFAGASLFDSALDSARSQVDVDPVAGGGPLLDGATSAFRLLGLCGVPIVLFGAYFLLRTLRYTAWLQGTRVFVRGALLTRSADLADADVSVGAVTYRQHHGSYDTIHRIPAIVAVDRRTRARVKIPLRGQGMALLPRQELISLARAMTHGRPMQGEHGRVHALAARLYQLANDPLSV